MIRMAVRQILPAYSGFLNATLISPAPEGFAYTAKMRNKVVDRCTTPAKTFPVYYSKEHAKPPPGSYAYVPFIKGRSPTLTSCFFRNILSPES